MATATDIEVKKKTKKSTKVPKMWKVVILNDDYTPMDFVIDLLITVFNHTKETAKEVTLEVHNSGSGIAGVYTHEIAEQKSIDASGIALANGHPLQIKIDQE